MMRSAIILICCLLWSMPAWAIEVYLNNGDKITGVIVSETDSAIVLKTLGSGTVTVDKAFVDKARTYPQYYAPPAAAQVEWKKTFSVGYTQTGGNTDHMEGMLSTLINRKTRGDEYTLRLDSFYSSTNDELDAKKFYGMLRYAYSFGRDLKWYKFYKLEGDQDRMAQIDYRLTPSFGQGYWFSDNDDLKAMTELAFGYQYTNYRVQTKSKLEPVLVPRLFVDKRLAGKLHLSEDFTMYPSLRDIKDYRYRSETALVNQITERWAFKMQFVDDFNTEAIEGTKKHDYRWIASLAYAL